MPGSGDSQRRRVAVVTGSRAEFGLLRPVMRAIRAHRRLDLLAIAGGAHLVPPGRTIDDVRREFALAAVVPMQRRGRHTRHDEVQALARGVHGFGQAFARLDPDWVVVLGDRIEALAAALAASLGGWALAHVHGGDRAEGIADDAIRHAITRLAHLHLVATEQSRRRVIRMGEPVWRVICTGSPAVDGLRQVAPLALPRWRTLGAPAVVVLMHPLGRDESVEQAAAAAVLTAAVQWAARRNARVLAFHPNADPGRQGILAALAQARRRHPEHLSVIEHLPRDQFLGMLRRLAGTGGVLAGNSSAGLIEAAALRLPVVNVGARQGGRQTPDNVVQAGESVASVRRALDRAARLDRSLFFHPYGDGHAGERIAAALARIDPHQPGFLRKRNRY